jgi:hypothetical protein
MGLLKSKAKARKWHIPSNIKRVVGAYGMASQMFLDKAIALNHEGGLGGAKCEVTEVCGWLSKNLSGSYTVYR